MGEPPQKQMGEISYGRKHLVQVRKDNIPMRFPRDGFLEMTLEKSQNTLPEYAMVNTGGLYVPSGKITSSSPARYRFEHS